MATADNLSSRQELATLGGGCFWCLEPVFEELTGVNSVVVGYAGGWMPNPPYQLVCTGTTGHAEVVQISFDPNEIAYEDLLRIFLTVHDPTTLNRQGNDVGPQYRSIIIWHSDEQREKAEKIMAEIDASAIWGKALVTELKEFKVFYPAEEYHQGYFKKNPSAGYCQVIIAPKVAKFRKQYHEQLKK
jgi:peptide-methionine (S)-S-oxide reductase